MALGKLPFAWAARAKLGQCPTPGSHLMLQSAQSVVGWTSQRQATCVATAKGGKQRRREQEMDLDRTNELMEELDIDSLLNNEEVMAALRAKLLSDMSRTHSGQVAAAVAPTPRSSGGAFDSDEYDSDALDTLNGSDVDVAQEAAHRLALDSSDIADHILAEHKDDQLMDLSDSNGSSNSWVTNRTANLNESARSTWKQQQQHQQQQKGQRQQRGQQQQQWQRQGSSLQQAESNSKTSNGTSPAGSSEYATSSTSSSKRQRASSAAAGSSTQLAGDTAIGRIASSRSNVAVVVLKKGKARLFEFGSPMVYSGAIDKVIGRPPPQSGDAVVVADANMVPIAWGVYNAVSMFRVRVFQVEAEALADDTAVLEIEKVIQLRVSQAQALRAALGLPSADTNVMRLINSEGDRLSGVVADMLGDTMVVQSCAAWSERYRECITSTIQQQIGASRVVWRPAAGILNEEGIQVPLGQQSTSTSSNTDAAHSATPLEQNIQQQQQQPDVWRKAADEQEQQQQQQCEPHSSDSNSSNSWLSHAVHVREGGLTFLATPEAGQKTGFYADQRHNRAFIASMSAEKTVLDLCCYSGGFALMAAAAGAAAVTGVDSSANAIELATANAELNDLSDRCAFVRDDVSTFLRAALEAGEAFDIVILDPPKFAPNRQSLARATIKYRRLNALALSVVRPGGMLMTCSCSGAMTQSGGLAKVVQEAAAEAERQVTLLARSGAAPDHPLHPAYPEGDYLTTLTYRVL